MSLVFLSSPGPPLWSHPRDVVMLRKYGPGSLGGTCLLFPAPHNPPRRRPLFRGRPGPPGPSAPRAPPKTGLSRAPCDRCAGPVAARAWSGLRDLRGFPAPRAQPAPPGARPPGQAGHFLQDPKSQVGNLSCFLASLPVPVERGSGSACSFQGRGRGVSLLLS